MDLVSRRSRHQHIVDLSTEADTQRFGAALAAFLAAGDWVSLIGPLGVGKTALARSVIQARLGGEVEVPSPSYTLVNIYGAEPEIWHADLYRISTPDEIDEIGLLDRQSECITLVEWPERLGGLLPDRRLEIALAFTSAEGRKARVTCIGDWPEEFLR
ncbi:MAG: tRNA (adenosine(37)-N6)-threonylcarbamoyltransferase complex ATPase subunit type 1 TsaE [Pseudomonadota bacterium]